MSEYNKKIKPRKTVAFTPDPVTGDLTEADAKRYFSRFGAFVFVFYLLCNVTTYAISYVFYLFFPNVYSSYLFSSLLTPVAFYAISLPIAYPILMRLPLVKPCSAKMGAGACFKGLCISAALMLAGSYVSNVFISFFEAFTGGSLTNPVEIAVADTPIWADVLFIAIVAPILEELVFRGILCKRLLMLGEGYAIIIPAAVFALCHGNFFQLFYAFTLGCFFSFIYVKTGRLRYSMLYHVIINLCGSVIAPIILDHVNLDAISESFTVTAENIFGILALMWYEMIFLGAAIVGIVIIVKHYKEMKPQSGLLPPPKGRVASCVMLNAGVAAAVALFTLTLVTSLLAY